jgi:hypothetical protein
MVIEALEQGLEGFFDIEEIDHKAGMRVHLAGEAKLDAIGMAVQPAAPMGLRHIGQMMRGLEGKGLGDRHCGHGGFLAPFAAQQKLKIA